jgi:hypothetical protein
VQRFSNYLQKTIASRLKSKKGRKAFFSCGLIKLSYMTRKLNARKRIAIVAHDNKKKDLIDWAWYNRDVLSMHELIGTGTTGKLLEEKLKQPVQKLMSGPLGGDQQIGSLIAE